MGKIFIILYIFIFSFLQAEQTKHPQKKTDVALNLKHTHSKDSIEDKSKNSQNESKSNKKSKKEDHVTEKTKSTPKEINNKKSSETLANKKEKTKNVSKKEAKEKDTQISITPKEPKLSKIDHKKENKENSDLLISKKSAPISKGSTNIPRKDEVTILSDTFEEIRFKEEGFTIIARANEFRQGNLAFIKIKEVKGKNKIDPTILFAKWADKYIPLHIYKDSYLGVVPISPEHPEGTSFLDIEKRDEDKTTIYKFPISIAKTNFPERKMYNPLRVPKKYILKEYSPETVEFIKKCEDKKQVAFSTDSELKLTGKFVLPLDKIFVTSPFYVRRYYHPSSPGKPHGGVDLRGKPGVPIYALQDGKVVIAERMFYEGIFTVIDHGSKVFSLYMHQSKLHVKEGDYVKAGEKIGEVGSTGISTGPHLHLGLKVDGEVINPLTILELSLFE
jgi:murein DD-endopeptidase MepM/ murein hydrolase activator NlpD